MNSALLSHPQATVRQSIILAQPLPSSDLNPLCKTHTSILKPEEYYWLHEGQQVPTGAARVLLVLHNVLEDQVLQI